MNTIKLPPITHMALQDILGCAFVAVVFIAAVWAVAHFTKEVLR